MTKGRFNNKKGGVSQRTLLYSSSFFFNENKDMYIGPNFAPLHPSQAGIIQIKGAYLSFLSFQAPFAESVKPIYW